MAKRKSNKDLFLEELEKSALPLPQFLLLVAQWNELSEEEKGEMIENLDLF